MSDDGRGIDTDIIRNKAIERGLIDGFSSLTKSELLQFILESGFSTADEVTQISGRGVGMDVVNSEIKQLGGSLQIDSDKGVRISEVPTITSVGVWIFPTREIGENFQ